MIFNKILQQIALILPMFLITGSRADISPKLSMEIEQSPINAAPTEKSPLLSFTLSPTSIQNSTPTINSKLTPGSVPAETVLSGIVRQLCPELRPPLGLFYVPEPIMDDSTDPATLYELYEIVELGLNSSSESCTFYLSPPPMGDPQIAGDSLFWKSYDYDNEWMMVWKYDSNEILVDDEFPQHSFLRQTRTNIPFEKVGLYDFLVAGSGEILVWTYTDPTPIDENQMGYVQEMYAAETSGPIDQRPAVEIWNDITIVEDSEAGIFRPRNFTLDEERIFYSQEPIGLGRQWPEPLGRYTSLYSFSTWWDTAYPELHFDCGRDYWCISDFSEQHNILIRVPGETLQIIELSSGDLIQEVQAPPGYALLRHAMISPDGTIAFLGLAMGGSDYGDPPEDAAIFILAPPYQDPPELLVQDNGLLNLVGWASQKLLVADGNRLDGNSTLPADLMLVDVESGVGNWLLLDAKRLVSLVP